MENSTAGETRPVEVAILFQTEGFEEVIHGLLRDRPEVTIVVSGRIWPTFGGENHNGPPHVVIVEREWALSPSNSFVTALLFDEIVDRILLCGLDDLRTTILSKKQVSNIDSEQLIKAIT